MTTTPAGTVADLDPDQRRVVDHDDGPLLVLGGPGTGKSLVVTERWVRLATEVTAPHRVLLLVATRERALALRDELPWRLDARAVVEIPVHTWHAFAYHLVTRYYRALGYSQPPVLLTAAEQWAVVRDLLASEDAGSWDAYAPSLTTRAFVDEVADFCLRASQRCATDDDLEALARDRQDHRAVVAFARRYRSHLRETARLDYAGLIGAAANLLSTTPHVRDPLAGRFPHVLVDDAQELAPAQVELLRGLNLSHLVCAGDPDSAIEAFRGADPSWLSGFTDLAAGHDSVVLRTCHRYGPQIGEAAARLISHAPRDAGHRCTVHAGPDDGRTDLCLYATLAAEIEAAARTVRSAHLSEAIPYERMAILVAQPGVYTGPLRRALDLLDVPHHVTGSDRTLSNEPVVRAVLDTCRLALDATCPDDVLKGVLASALFDVDPHTVRELARDAFRAGRPLREVVSSHPVAHEYVAVVQSLADHCGEPADATLERLIAACPRLQELLSSGDDEAAPATQALTALSRALARFVERRRGGTMLDYLQSSARADLSADTWLPSSGPNRGVTVTSFHAAKGAEWDVVCVLGANEGQIPKAHRAQGLFDPWALDQPSAVERALAQLAEERRTFYVAITRATRRLSVSSSPGSSGRALPSRFAEEAFGDIPEPLSGCDVTTPLTLSEAEGMWRRTLADPAAQEHAKRAAACALASIPGIDPQLWWWRRGWTAPNAPLAPDGKLTTSYSRIGTYENCPLQYVLQSVLGLDPQTTYQMKFGSLVHKLIERVENGEVTEWDEVMRLYREGFDQSDYPNIVFARTYFTEGVRMLKRWWASERLHGDTIAVEYAFNDLDLDGHTIRGRIDRVAKVAKGLLLVDYKTSKSMLTAPKAKESLQLSIYYLAAKTYDDLRQHGEPYRMQLVYPGIDDFQQPGQPARRTQYPDDAEQVLTKLEQILSEATAERFAPKPDADCQWCKMRPLCPRYPEGREVAP